MDTSTRLVSFIEGVQFFAITLFRMALDIAKCSSITSSKAKECRYQVTERVYGVFTELRSHKVTVIGCLMRFDILKSDKFVRICLTQLSCLMVHKM